MNPETVYICGPMTGYKDWNFPAFFEAEKLLIAEGYEVVNPAWTDGLTLETAIANAGLSGSLTHNEYLREAVRMLVTCDAVCVLPGWEDSVGARVEVDLAAALDMPVLTLAGWTLKQVLV